MATGSYVIGIDVGGQTTKLGVVDARGAVLAQTVIRTDNHDTVEPYIAELAEAVNKVIADAKAEGEIRGIGVGAPNGNYYTGNIESAPNLVWAHNTVEFADGEFECDLTKLFVGSHYDEDDNLVDKDGNVIHTAGTEVNVSIPVFGCIEMSDYAEEGGVTGNIVSLIYKGDHYQYIVRTENEYDFIFDDEDLWNENDYVSLIIKKENINLTLK